MRLQWKNEPMSSRNRGLSGNEYHWLFSYLMLLDYHYTIMLLIFILHNIYISELQRKYGWTKL